MEKNILIVHYNTQRITECCIRSINKTTPGCKIYVFDNSDREPFENSFDNVTVIDNTSGQVADFQKILDRHTDVTRTTAMDNNFGSFKHCYSVDTAMDIIGDGFVLMDSDILLKRDFSVFYNENMICVGRTEKQSHLRKRIAPYMMYINVRMCKEKGIRFFDEDHMFGLYDSTGQDIYDTGCWFYEQTYNLPRREIPISQYMIHFRAASWYKDAVEKQRYRQMTPAAWLERHKYLWDDSKRVVKKLGASSPGRKYVPKERKEIDREKYKDRPVIRKQDMAKVTVKVEAFKKKKGNVVLLKSMKNTNRKIGLINM